MSPRYFFDHVGTPAQLMKRVVCAAGQHSCAYPYSPYFPSRITFTTTIHNADIQSHIPGQDINFPSSCCDDTKFCYLNSSGSPSCCAIGSNCDNPCPVDQYRCNKTTTVSGKATTTATCCGRPCTASLAFECVGGSGCCSLGFSCSAVTTGTATLNQCVSTAAPSTSALVGEAPPGCSTSQFSCAASEGGGCCGLGETCTQRGSQLICATGTSSAGPMRSGALPSGLTQTGKGGLSTGAKAGIGAGVGLLGAVAICSALWFCMRRRRKESTRTTPSQSDATETSGPTGMSQTGRGPGRRRGGAQADYFGPTATAGPYTDYSSPSSTPFGVGVPLSPDAPGDITAAVEIGNSRDHSTVTSPGEMQTPEQQHVIVNPELKPVPETVEHRVELP